MSEKSERARADTLLAAIEFTLVYPLDPVRWLRAWTEGEAWALVMLAKWRDGTGAP